AGMAACARQNLPAAHHRSLRRRACRTRRAAASLSCWIGPPFAAAERGRHMTLRLLLYRHAKSAWDQPGLPDIARKLADRGISDAALMAATIEARQLLPERILCSA